LEGLRGSGIRGRHHPPNKFNRISLEQRFAAPNIRIVLYRCKIAARREAVALHWASRNPAAMASILIQHPPAEVILLYHICRFM